MFTLSGKTVLSRLIILCGLLLCLWCCTGLADADTPASETLRLWTGDAPGALSQEDQDIPTLTIYRALTGKANGAAIILLPGGSYGGLTDETEMAEWLNTLGITSAVLKYRLSPRYDYKSIVSDAIRAMRVVRAHAGDWHLDPHRIGLLGRSAGGHLAAIVATSSKEEDSTAVDPIDRISARPDLLLLIYPLITMQDAHTHLDSRRQFLGENPRVDLLDRFSLEKHVTSDMPPTFIVHGADDKAVPVENSLLFALALKTANVPFALHIYDHGQHGFGIDKSSAAHGSWSTTCAAWLKEHGFLASDKSLKH